MNIYVKKCLALNQIFLDIKTVFFRLFLYFNAVKQDGPSGLVTDQVVTWRKNNLFTGETAAD